MKIVTAKEMQYIDKITIEEKGVPSEVLMGFAGKSIADYILQNFADLTRVVIFSGTGNNGGDGFVIGYLLANKGVHVDIYITGSKEKISITSSLYYSICLNFGITITELKDDAAIVSIELDSYDLIIDAMLGTGFNGVVRGIAKDVIEKINKSSTIVLSVDLPSGLPSDGVAPHGIVVQADYTVTIGLPKISLVTYPGKSYTGRLHVSDIGFPSLLTESEDLGIDLLNKSYVQRRLDFTRDVDAHKGASGHLLFIGGFDNMEGAIIMAVMAAFQIGVGLSTLLTTCKARSIIAGRIPELITRSIDSLEHQGKVDNNIVARIENDIRNFFHEDRNYKVVVIGPGMGRSEVSACLFELLMNNFFEFGIKMVLIDGDGLYHLTNYFESNCLHTDISFIITPHFYEASRLMGQSVDEIKNDRVQAAVELSQKTSAVTLLKGPASIISDGKKTLINTTGNPSLATAGSGDVLSGMIGALLLQDHISPLDAAGIGAYLHGSAADSCSERYLTPVIKATDIIEYIRGAISEVLSP